MEREAAHSSMPESSPSCTLATSAHIPKSNSPGRSRGCINYREKALALALLATALLSGFLLPGPLALLAGLLLATLLLAGSALLAALVLLTGLVLAALLAAALATLIGIVHDHSCCEVAPDQE
jgi:hypothetical protein